MSYWNALAEIHLTPLLTAEQREIVAARPAALNGVDPVQEALAHTTARLRAEIRSSQPQALGADEYQLPPELIRDAAWITLNDLIGLIPGLVLHPTQSAEVRDAEKRIEAVRSGKLTIEAASDAIVSPLPPSPRATTAIVAKRRSKIGYQQLLNL